MFPLGTHRLFIWTYRMYFHCLNIHPLVSLLCRWQQQWSQKVDWTLALTKQVQILFVKLFDVISSLRGLVSFSNVSTLLNHVNIVLHEYFFLAQRDYSSSKATVMPWKAGTGESKPFAARYDYHIHFVNLLAVRFGEVLAFSTQHSLLLILCDLFSILILCADHWLCRQRANGQRPLKQ